MKTTGLLTFLTAALLVPAAALAACDQESAAQVRASNMNAQAKINMLKGFGCPADDLTLALTAVREEVEKQMTEREAQRRAQDATALEAKQKASQEQLTALVSADNAARDAFDQDMANKCGAYPLDLKIGFSEKLLKIGCAGQADLVGESKDGRVYRLPSLLVSVQKGKVTRWVSN